MAVYTHITQGELNEFLKAYDLGSLQSFEGIEKGVSNTNYNVFTDKGRYILTIFEENRTRRADLPYLFAYAGHLAGQGVACPQVFMDRSGETIKDIQGKPAAIISFLDGEDRPRGETMAKHCGEMGAFVANMHKAAANFSLNRENDWGKQAWRAKADAIGTDMERFQPGLKDIIYTELDYLDERWVSDVPQRAVHLDLFPDNIFFDGARIVAMIDMYFAANDLLAYDLAITVNAWCFSTQGNWRRPAFRRLIHAYEKIRPLEDAEKQNFQTYCRGACMRFLLSRLEEWFNRDTEKSQMKPHDPREYMERLKFHQDRDVMECLR